MSDQGSDGAGPWRRGSTGGDQQQPTKFEGAIRRSQERVKRMMPKSMPGAFPLVLLALFVLVTWVALTSFVYVGKDETGQLVRIYLGDDLKEGAIIATNDEKGPQAKILPPGFHFQPFLRVLYDVTMEDIFEIQTGDYGYLVARDGQPLRPDQTYADPFDPSESAEMFSNAAHFLTSGGQKGPQTAVITPGKYRLNRFLWQVTPEQATDIPPGRVGVIKSNVHARVDFGNLKTDIPADCSLTRRANAVEGELAVPLVPVGCIGIWDKALNPGQYYINRHAYEVTLVNTRVKAWEYRGGFTRRFYKLTVNQEGRITQEEQSFDVPVPQEAKHEAVFLKIEGWTVAQQLRALVQVTPENAPFVVASVGGVDDVEDRIIFPAVQSVIRNVLGGSIRVATPILNKNGDPVLDDNNIPQTKIITRPTRVLDLIENRTALEENVERLVRIEGAKAGVDIKEIRFLDPDLPPELLIARKREQLAEQLSKAYRGERAAQLDRIAAEQTRATADQQDKLVDAQIEVKRSEQFAIARSNEGRGERDKLQLIAEGQKAQAEILGEDRVVELRKFEFAVGRMFDFFEKQPGVLEAALTNAHKFVPERVFTIGADGGGNNLAGAAGILGDFLSGGRPPPDKPQ